MGWSEQLAAEYLGLLIGAWGIGWALGYLIRSVERFFEAI